MGLGANGRKLAAIVAVVVILVAAIGVYQLYKPGAKPEETTIKIGIVAPTTGGMSKTGKDMWQAAQLAAKEINEAGGVYVESLGKNLTI